MIIDQSDCSNLDGFTDETSGGAGTVTATGSSIDTDRTSGSGTSPLGFYRSSPQVGASGQIIYWKFSYSGLTPGFGHFVGGLNKNAAVNYTAVPSIYLDESGGNNIFITWRGSSTVNSATTAAINTDYFCKAVINSDGTITFSVATAGFSGPWTALSSSLVAQSYDATTTDIYFVGCDVWSATGVVSTKYFIYTDNGDIAPNEPASVTATADSSSEITLEWVDDFTSDQAKGVLIERSLTSGSGFVEIYDAAVGDQLYQDTGLSASTTYYYRLRSYVEVDGTTYYSDYTSEVDATTDASVSGSDGGKELLVLGDL